MSVENVCILGGSGFVGRATAERLCAQGRRVKVLTRDRQLARHLIVLPTIEVVAADVHDPAQLARHFEGMDAVVNLVAILHEKRAQGFQSVHVDLPRKVIEACALAGVRRFVHMSALGADPAGPSRYLRSKGEGEQVVRKSPLAWTILRPSVIFGANDTFLNLFASLARALPVLALARPGARFQPIWVEDVVRVLATCLDDPATIGQSYNLCGPRAYTLDELVGYVITLTGRRRLVLALPDWAASLQAFVLEHLPGPIMTRDNLLSMSVDNVCGGPFPEAFGFHPSALEAVVPEYLAESNLKGRYRNHRYRAGR
jgi:NADH dehydrogenase